MKRLHKDKQTFVSFANIMYDLWDMRWRELEAKIMEEKMIEEELRDKERRPAV